MKGIRSKRTVQNRLELAEKLVNEAHSVEVQKFIVSVLNMHWENNSDEWTYAASELHPEIFEGPFIGSDDPPDGYVRTKQERFDEFHEFVTGGE